MLWLWGGRRLVGPRKLQWLLSRLHGAFSGSPHAAPALPVSRCFLSSPPSSPHPRWWGAVSERSPARVTSVWSVDPLAVCPERSLQPVSLRGSGPLHVTTLGTCEPRSVAKGGPLGLPHFLQEQKRRDCEELPSVETVTVTGACVPPGRRVCASTGTEISGRSSRPTL